MKFHDFLEALYVETNLKNNLGYHPYLAAKTTAIQSLLNVQKSILKKISYFAILYNYFKVVLSIKEAPKSAHEQVRLFNEAKQKHTDKTPIHLVQETEG
jgi:hypothetical protein